MGSPSQNRGVHPLLGLQKPRVPWYARAFAAIAVGYAFSPIDLIPDPIPVLGYLDEVILIPIGIALTIRMIPPDVMSDCRERARTLEDKPVNKTAAVVNLIWLLLATAAAALILQLT